MFFPAENDFLKLTKKGNLIPVYKEILGDLETPVSAFYRIAHDAEYSFLLESVEGEEKVCRYSFLSKDPEMIFETKGNQIKLTRFTKGMEEIETLESDKNPLSFIRKILKQYKFVDTSGLPRFCGGLVGYLSYDSIRYFENIPDENPDDLNIPDILLVLAKELVIFDHRNHRIKVVYCVEIDPESSDETKLKEYKKAIKRIDKRIDELNRPILITKGKTKAKKEPTKWTSNLSETEFKNIVKKAKQDIRAGEIIQVVLSQRLKFDLKTDPFNIYRTLRALNPSPYMYYLNFNGLTIIGSSPELLVRCEDGVVETRPIAGTRPRGKDEQHDERLAQELLNDPKEIAEHIMLVDLGRNDLGRISKKGSVHLSEFMIVEKYSHVMHIVSNVKGKLKPGKDALDVLQAAFPAGTVSGAPKIRAMEIIDRLENLKRGPYAGCIGYFDFSGNLDTCITIRTIVAKDGKAYLQAGAGIVADSKPQKEYEETLNKAKALISAIELAEKQTN